MRLLHLWAFTTRSRVDRTFKFPLPFLTSLVDGMAGTRHSPANLPPGKRVGAYHTERCVECGEEKIQ